MSNAIPTELSVNGKNYSVIKLLGKGKGGYSYLAVCFKADSSRAVQLLSVWRQNSIRIK